jgi:tetratricopeptide (TPR) repeat protein
MIRMPRTFGPGGRFLLGLLGLALLALARYAWTPGISFINDDFLFLERARTATFLDNWSGADALGNVYRPLTRNLYFWLGLRIFGREPGPYHLLNLGIFALSGVLLALTVQRLVARAGRIAPESGAAPAAGLGAGLCFVLHPAAGTPASWVCGVQDLAAVDLVLLAILCHLSGRRLLYLLAYAAAVLSKETAAPLFLLLALWDLGVERVGWQRALGRQLPAALGCGIWLVLNPWLPWNELGRTIHAREPGRPSVLGRFDLMTVWITVRALFLVEPAERFTWPYGPLATALQVVLTVLVLALAIGLSGSTPSAGREWSRPPVADARARLGLLGFAIAWSASGILPLVIIISHFVYYAFYPALGLSLAIGALAFLSPRRIWLGAAGVSAAVLALFLGAGIVYHPALCDAHNIRRASDHLWRFRSNLEALHPAFPESARIYLWNLPPWIGFQLADGPAFRVWYGDATLSGYFLSTYTPNPRRPSFFFGHDDAMNLIEIVKGRPDPGLADPPPIYTAAHNDLGATLSGVGEREAAIVEWQKVLEVDPDFKDSVANLGMTLAKLDRNAEALPVLERAVALDPQAPDVRLMLGRVAFQLGQYPLALAQLETFLALAPDYPMRAQVEAVIAGLKAEGIAPALGVPPGS